MIPGFFIGLAIALAIRHLLAQGITVRDADAGERWECPRCAEKIKVRASVCRFCGLEISPALAAAAPHQVIDVQPTGTLHVSRSLSIVLLALIVAGGAIAAAVFGGR